MIGAARLLTLRPSLGPRDRKYGSAAQAPMSTTRDVARAALFLGALCGMPASCSPLVSSQMEQLPSAIFTRTSCKSMQFDSGTSVQGAWAYCNMAGARNGSVPLNQACIICSTLLRLCLRCLQASSSKEIPHWCQHMITCLQDGFWMW